MANMNKPHACLFDGVEDVEAGYVLITVIKHGTQGQACIVRSLTDGNVYVRKRLVKRSEHLATEELSFSDLIPASMTPEIVQHFDGETKAPTLIYAFCNGGDLSAFIKKCCKNDKVIPEAVFWHMEKQLIEIIACIHSGWQNDVGFQEVRPEDFPIALFDKLWKEGIELEFKTSGMLITKYIAEKFILRADIKIAELQAEEFHDFR